MGFPCWKFKKKFDNRKWNSKTAISYLAEVVCGNTVILPTRHPMDIHQHLILGFDELGLIGAGNNKTRSHRTPGKRKIWTTVAILK